MPARARRARHRDKVKIDNYGQDRDGISAASLDEVAFAYLKKYGGNSNLGNSR